MSKAEAEGLNVIRPSIFGYPVNLNEKKNLGMYLLTLRLWKRNFTILNELEPTEKHKIALKAVEDEIQTMRNTLQNLGVQKDAFKLNDEISNFINEKLSKTD